MVPEETEEMNRRHYYDKNNDFYLKQFLSAFACKMRLIALTNPSLSVYQGYCHGTDFCEILCSGFLLNFFRHIPLLVKIGQKKGALYMDNYVHIPYCLSVYDTNTRTELLSWE